LTWSDVLPSLSALGSQFYVENVQEELDDDREWFATGDGMLLYMPLNGTDMNR
jgi:hypothetical protein